jgi:hypothetical protein
MLPGMDDFRFRSELWRWEAQTTSAWYFVSVPVDLSADLRMEAGPPRGFGSIRVRARIGASIWKTSIFPSAETGGFVLPVKKAIRSAEGLEEGETCAVDLELIDD